MPRRNRPTAAGIYHASTRAQRDDELFRDDADFVRLESEVRLLVETATWACIAPCAVTVETDEQLVSAYRYIARNPVEAGICMRPQDWRWSSHPTLVGEGDRPAAEPGTCRLQVRSRSRR